MKCLIISGTFFGGEIEPGTFHEPANRQKVFGEDRRPSTGGTDDTNAQTPAENEDA